MNILIACEESQRVCAEFRKLGHDAFTCDVVDCSGGYPEWHIKSDVLQILNGYCTFVTCDGITHFLFDHWDMIIAHLPFLFDHWDMIIAHPPCIYLTVTGNRWFNVERYSEKALQRIEEREKAIDFFLQLANADCDKICIENPVGIISTRWRKLDQIIQPYMFGDSAEKKTRACSRELKRLKKLRQSERSQTRSHLREQNRQLTMLYYDILGGKYNDK